MTTITMPTWIFVAMVLLSAFALTVICFGVITKDVPGDDPK